MIAPVLLHFATTAAGLPTPATSTALWVCFGLSVGGALAGICLYLLGRVRPAAPAVATWMQGQQPAWQSPPLLAAVRHIPRHVTDSSRSDGALGSYTAGTRHPS
jgi:hypothetical protein